MGTKLDRLMATEMTRKQFIIALGMLFVGFFGFSAIIGMLTEDEPKKEVVIEYGMGNYGP